MRDETLFRGYMLSDAREKMVGANLRDDGIKGAFELWLERKYFRVDADGVSAVIMESGIRQSPVPYREQVILNLGGTADVKSSP